MTLMAFFFTKLVMPTFNLDRGNHNPSNDIETINNDLVKVQMMTAVNMNVITIVVQW